MESHEDLSKINRDELLRELESHANPPKSPEAEHTDPGAKVRNELHDIFGQEMGDQIDQAMSDVNSTQEKNRKSADEVMNKMAEVLGSMPPEKSKKIFEEVINGMITNNPYGPVPEEYRIKFQNLLNQVRLMPDSIPGKDDSKKTGGYKIIDIVPSEAESQPIPEVPPQPEIVVTEADLKENYEAALSLYGKQPFTFEDFVWHVQGPDWENATENEKSLVTKIFEKLLADGKLKKLGDGSNRYRAIIKKTVHIEPVPEEASQHQDEVIPAVPPESTEKKFEITAEQKQKCREAIIYLQDIKRDLGTESDFRLRVSMELERFCYFMDYIIAGKEDFNLVKEKIDGNPIFGKPEINDLYKIFGFENESATSEKPDTEATRVIPLPAEEILVPADVPPQPEVLPVIQAGEVLPVSPEIPFKPVILENLEDFAPPTPPAQDLRPMEGPMTFEQAVASAPDSSEKEKIIEDNLDANRNLYVEKYIEFKNKSRENKRWYGKIMSDLGFENSVGNKLPMNIASMRDVREGLDSADRLYTLAKKRKAQDIFEYEKENKAWEIKNKEYEARGEEAPYVIIPTGPELIAQAEKEWNTLQNRIMEHIPPVEKGRIGKAFEKWAKLPLPARIAMSTVLMTGFGMTLGTVAVSGVGGTLAYRGVKSIMGATAGLEAGGFADIKMRRTLQKKIGEVKKAYSKEISEDNFEQKEKEWMRYKEKEQNQIKINRLKKAGVMMAVGAGFNFGADFATSHLNPGGIPGATPVGQHGFLYKMFHHDNAPKTGDAKGIVNGVIDQKPGAGNVPRGTKLNTNVPPSADQLPGPKPGTGLAGAEKPPVSAIPRAEAPTPLKSPMPTELTPKIPEAVNVAEVELNKLGFIKTFQEMKEQLKLKYPNPDATDVPTGVKHFLQTPSTKLAQEYGFWDTKHGTSGMGLKGEHLAVDAEGHLKLEHLAGKPTEVIDTGANKFDTLHSDKMHVFKAPAPHEVVAPKVAEPVFYEGSTHPQSNEIFPENGAEKISALESATPHTGRIYDAYGTEIIPDSNPANPLENVVAPKASFEHIARDEFGQPVVPGAKVAETFHSTLDFTHHSASGMDLHIKVAEVVGGQKHLLVGDTAIANQVSLPDGSTRMQLFNNLQHGKQSAILREAFVAAQKKLEITLPKGASSGSRLSFDHGTVNLVHGVPGDPNEIHAYLNGKEIAKGLATTKGPNLTLDTTLHRQFWWQGDTVYDTAFKFLKKNIKLRNNSDILKDLTLPRVVNK